MQITSRRKSYSDTKWNPCAIFATITNLA